MGESSDKTDDVGLHVDDMPIIDSNTSGIASASQLVDGTNDVRLDENYTG